MPQQSLDSFYAQSGSVNLDNCDREPLHLSGAIQNAGMLVVAKPETGRIVTGSLNVPGIQGAEYPEMAQLFPELVTALETETLSRSGRVQHHILDYAHEYEGNRYNVVFHHVDGYDVFEFLPLKNLTSTSLRAKLRFLRRECRRIVSAPSWDAALQIGVEAVQAITGYARIKIYRFLNDWSGKVVAEACDAHMPSYLGLHFPDTDIPRQARHLFQLLPYRCIAKASDDTVPLSHLMYPDKRPVDLTWSVLRSVSPMHTAYLRNMEVNATLSVALVYQDTLWGLFACHNHEEGMIPYDLWGLVGDVGEALMAKYEQEKQKALAAKIFQIRKIEEQVAEVINQKEDLESSLTTIMPRLNTFLDSDGFAFIYGEEVFHSGKVPPDAFIKSMIEWVRNQRFSEGRFVTKCLHDHWPDAKEHIDTACGVLIEPVELHRVCQLVWFRGPITQTASWAGDPNEKKMQERPDGTHILSPRNSFESWVIEHNDRSAEWTDAEVDVAREVLKNMLDLVTSHLLLTRTASDLQLFSYAAAHDIKGPLRAIRFALEAARYNPDKDSPEVVQHILDKGIDSTDRLQSLISQLMQYLILGKEARRSDPVSLNKVVAKVKKQLHDQLEETSGALTTENLPVIQGSDELLSTMVFNLVENAIKYRHPDRPPVISVTAHTREDTVELTVTDNGIGISPEEATKIFEPFKRLHHHSEIKGTGLGLAISRRVAELHEGHLDLDTSYTEGARFKLVLRNSSVSRT